MIDKKLIIKDAIEFAIEYLETTDKMYYNEQRIEAFVDKVLESFDFTSINNKNYQEKLREICNENRSLLTSYYL